MTLKDTLDRRWQPARLPPAKAEPTELDLALSPPTLCL